MELKHNTSVERSMNLDSSKFQSRPICKCGHPLIQHNLPLELRNFLQNRYGNCKQINCICGEFHDESSVIVP
jgi:hypothetical protein